MLFVPDLKMRYELPAGHRNPDEARQRLHPENVLGRRLPTETLLATWLADLNRFHQAVNNDAQPQPRAPVSGASERFRACSSGRVEFAFFLPFAEP